jgi:hypothetical protein
MEMLSNEQAAAVGSVDKNTRLKWWARGGKVIRANQRGKFKPALSDAEQEKAVEERSPPKFP